MRSDPFYYNEHFFFSALTVVLLPNSQGLVDIRPLVHDHEDDDEGSQDRYINVHFIEL